MEKKNTKIHMRVDRSTKERLITLKLKKETDGELLERLARIFEKRGIPREINQAIQKLQEITNTYVCPELHETLELFRIWLVLLTKINIEEDRVHEVEGVTKILMRRVSSKQKQMEEF